MLHKTTSVLHAINGLITLSTRVTWIFVFIASIFFYFSAETVIQSEQTYQKFTIFEYTLDKGINVSTSEEPTIMDGVKSALVVMGSIPITFLDISWKILQSGSPFMPHILLKILWYIIGIIPAFWGGIFAAVISGIILAFKYMFINGVDYYLLGYLIPWALFALPVITYPLTHLEENLKKRTKSPA
ncbi:hypothetical protein [Bacillus benzoevorans]|uniref:Uncharacterized protein n=1 Tax=Bacillus benzoevorans TaxID=1456 RepID=A0A7X0HVQ4_9BACI|nr:hypothetical protein [Bacillus benzoevorans]MBB6446807.1 hypothetical protein [Bacillus benzoevorans]